MERVSNNSANRLMTSLWITVLVTLFIFIAGAGCGYAADTVDSGTVSNTDCNITWSLDSDGVLNITGTGTLTWNGTAEAPWYSNISKVKSVIVGDGITSIGRYAFTECVNLKSIDLPDGIKSIGDYAFQSCSELTTVTNLDDVETIGSSAFYKCSSLAEISLPDGLSSIGGGAFSNCTSLKKIVIPDSVKTIGSSAFFSCSMLATVSLPKDLKVINSNMFTACRNLETINIPDGVTSIGDGAFSQCRALKSITFPASLLTIKQLAFESSGLTSITVPEKVSIIDRSAFCDCSNLESAVIKSTSASLGDYAFQNCKNLKTITISGVITSVGEMAFDNCISLTDITIPDGASSIGSQAFRNCTSLENVSIPSTVGSMGNPVFKGCSALKSMTLPFIGSSAWSTGTDNTFGVLFGSEQYDGGSMTTQYVAYESVEWCMPQKITTVKVTGGNIGNGTFYNCSSLKNITIPNGLTEIGTGAFYNCTNLTSIEIPEGVSIIGEDAFRGCKNLAKATLPDSLKSFGARAFYECESLKSIIIPKDVTVLSDSLFNSCKTMESIEIPDGLTKIEHGAFIQCNSLKSIDIPAGVKSIGNSAFSNCSTITSIDIPYGISSISEYLFNGCTSLTRVEIPETVTSIGSYAFVNCDSLKSLEIPSSVISIGERSFGYSNGLTKLIIPEGVTTIGSCAFDGLYSLKELYVPGSVTTIGDDVTGQITPTVYVVPGSYAASCGKFADDIVVNICDPVDTSDKHYLGFSADSVYMSANGTINLSDYLITDLNIADCTVKISDEALFLYDDGQIANFGNGECDLTVSCGKLSAAAKLIAGGSAASITGLSLSNSSLTMAKGDTAVNTVTLTPQNADIKNVEWISSDTTVAKVENGKIIAVDEGEAVITARASSNSNIFAKCDVTVGIPLYDIVPLETSMSIKKGGTKKISFYKYPYNTDEKVTFSSSDETVATVDEKGIVTAKDAGSAEIALSCGAISKKVKVEVYIPLEGISLNKTSAQLQRNDTLQLNVIYDPVNATFKDVVWSSNKESVATVDENGLVTATGKGIVAITATVGDYTASCTVVCKAVSLQGISLDNSAEIAYGKTYAPKLSFTPENTTDDTTATWESGDSSVFTVSAEGVVTPTGIGTATLTAKVGAFTASSEITVVKGTPEYTVPTGIKTSCMKKLSELDLPAGFAWADGDVSVGDAGPKSFSAIFTPDDQTHYNNVEDIQIEVVVEHSFGETWKSDGSKHWHECACGEKDAAESHSFGAWEEARKASCTETGIMEKTCSVCGAKETMEIPATGHKWDDKVTADVEPTYETEGSGSIHCKVCGEIKPGSTVVLPVKEKDPEWLQALADKDAALKAKTEAETSLAKAQDDLATANATIGTLNETVESQKASLADKEAALKKANDDLAAANASLKTATEDLAEANSKLADANTTIENLQKAAEGNNEDLLEALNDLSAAQKELAETKTALETATKNYGDTKAELDTATATIADLRKQLADKDSELTEANAAKEAALKAKTEAETSLAKAQEELATAEKAEEQAKADAEKAKTAEAEARKAVEEANKTIDTLTAEKTKLESQIAAAESDEAELQKSLDAVNSELTSVKKEKADAETAAAEATKQKNQALEDLQAAESAMNVAIQAKNAAEQAKEDAEAEIERLRKALSATDIRSATISKISDVLYTGSAVTPAVKVVMDGKTLVKGTDYSVYYINNIQIGTATVIVFGEGKYDSACKTTFKIVKELPISGQSEASGKNSSEKSASAAKTSTKEIVSLPAAKVSNPKAAKKAVTVIWKKISKKNLKKVKKIEIQYSTDKKFKKSVKKKYASAKKKSLKIKKLKSKKTYYIRIRSYMKKGGKVYVSKWSKVKKVKTK